MDAKRNTFLRRNTRRITSVNLATFRVASYNVSPGEEES